MVVVAVGMGRIQEMFCSWSPLHSHSGLRLGTQAALIPAVGTPTPATSRENMPRKKISHNGNNPISSQKALSMDV